MIRQHLFDKRTPSDKLFRWRGGDVSRLESLSDGVFAFALTLLVVSLEVPRTYAELWRAFREFPAFAVCFALLVMCWFYHYRFFRRYGLEDLLTIFLNTFLLFLILFYVYPLKFLFTMLWGELLGDPMQGIWAVPPGMEHLADAIGQGPRTLILLYSAGTVGIFGLYALMNTRAYLMRRQLELDELECYLTRVSIRTDLISLGIGLLSISLVLVGFAPAVGGLVYFLMPFAHAVNGWWSGTQADRMYRQLVESAGEAG